LTISNPFGRFHPKISVENRVFTLTRAYTLIMNRQTQGHTLQVELEDVERTEWEAVKVKHDEDAGERRTSVKFGRKKKTEGKREQG